MPLISGYMSFILNYQVALLATFLLNAKLPTTQEKNWHTHTKNRLEETHKHKAQKKLLLTQSSSRMCVKYKTSFFPKFKASATNNNIEETITKTISLWICLSMHKIIMKYKSIYHCEPSLHYARVLLYNFVKCNLQNLATFSTAKQNLPTKYVQYLQSLWQL